MITGLHLVSAPAVEPITLAQAKEWLRVDAGDSSQDSTLSDLITGAREVAELKTGRQLITATWNQTLDRFPGLMDSVAGGGGGGGAYQYATVNDWYWTGNDPRTIRLLRSPLQAVVSLKYLDTTNVVQTVDPSLYLVDGVSDPARITPAYGQIWPVARYQNAAVTVQFTSGYGADGSAVPSRIKQAIRLLIGWDYENRTPTKNDMSRVDELLHLSWNGEYR